MKFPQTFPLLSTERLLLRELVPSDKDVIFDILKDSLVTKYYDTPTFTRMSQAEKLLDMWMNVFPKKKGIRWGIVLKDTNTLIGTCGFCKVHKKWSVGEIGYVIARPYWNKGYVSECIQAMLAYGFNAMECNRIEAWTMKGNDASDHVLMKNGFQKEGSLRESQIWNGVVRDVVMFGILRREYI